MLLNWIFIFFPSRVWECAKKTRNEEPFLLYVFVVFFSSNVDGWKAALKSTGESIEIFDTFKILVFFVCVRTLFPFFPLLSLSVSLSLFIRKNLYSNVIRFNGTTFFHHFFFFICAWNWNGCDFVCACSISQSPWC